MIIILLTIFTITSILLLLIVLFITYVSNLMDAQNKVKMSFENFRILYERNSNLFYLSEEFPIVHGRIRRYEITFNFIDYLKYLGWVKRKQNKQTEDDFIKELSKSKGEEK